MAEKKSRNRSKKRLGRGLSSLIGQPVTIKPDDEQPSNQPDSSPNEPSSQSSDTKKADSTTNTSDVSITLEKQGGKRRHGKETTTKQGDFSPTAGPVQNASADSIVYIPLDMIRVNPHQPRQDMDPSALEQLAASIREAGVMQPILVRKPNRDRDIDDDDNNGERESFILVAGERRWRAAQLAGLETIPALVRDASQREAAELALIENLQREDLNPIERAEAFQNLIQEFGLTQTQVAERVGIDRSSVANILRINSLDDKTKVDIRTGRLSLGHAKVLLSCGDSEVRRALAEAAVLGRWSVRELERRVERLNHGRPSSQSSPHARRGKSQHILDLECELSDRTGLSARIRLRTKRQSGEIAFSFSSLDQFDEFMNLVRSIPETVRSADEL